MITEMEPVPATGRSSVRSIEITNLIFSYKGTQHFYSVSRVSPREYVGSFWLTFPIHRSSLSRDKSGSGTNSDRLRAVVKEENKTAKIIYDPH